MTERKLTLTADQKDMLRAMPRLANVAHAAMKGIAKCLNHPERYPGQLQVCIEREAWAHRAYKQNLGKLVGKT